MHQFTDCRPVLEFFHLMSQEEDNSNPQLYYYQLKKYKVIVPLRHPRRILESFNRRDKPISNYHQQWKHMLMLPVYKPVYVHVDNKRSRNRQVKAIGKLLNMELSTAWPLSERSGSKYGTHDIPLKDCPEAPQEYIDFYENTL